MRSFPEKDRARIMDAIEKLVEGGTASVKRLTDFHPQYRLRVGNYRVLFNVEGQTAVIYRVKLRKDAYRS